MVQVATSTEVYVFHVKHFARGVRVGAAMEVIERALEPLSPLLTSSAVFKVGVGVLGDVSLLQKFSRTLTCRCALLVRYLSLATGKVGNGKLP